MMPNLREEGLEAVIEGKVVSRQEREVRFGGDDSAVDIAVVRAVRRANTNR